jgi:hypothetical protein
MKVARFLPSTARGIMDQVYEETVGCYRAGEDRPSSWVALASDVADLVGAARSSIAKNVKLLINLGFLAAGKKEGTPPTIGHRTVFKPLLNLGIVSRAAVLEAVDKMWDDDEDEVAAPEAPAQVEAKEAKGKGTNCPTGWTVAQKAHVLPTDKKPIPIADTEHGKLFIANTLATPVQVSCDVRDGDFYLSLAAQGDVFSPEHLRLQEMLNETLNSNLGYVDNKIVGQCLQAMNGLLTVEELHTAITKNASLFHRSNSKRSWGGVVLLAVQAANSKQAAMRKASAAGAKFADELESEVLESRYQQWQEDEADAAFAALSPSERDAMIGEAAAGLSVSLEKWWKTAPPEARTHAATGLARRRVKDRLNLASFEQWKTGAASRK